MNYAMPFIRYRIGDRGRLTERSCSCGRQFPLLDALSGRVMEAMTNSKGEHVDSGFIMFVLTYIAQRGYLRQFQIIQEENGSLTIDVVLENGASLAAHSGDLQYVKEKLQVVMGQDCEVRFRVVDGIPTNAAGKYPYVVNRRSGKSTESSSFRPLMVPGSWYLRSAPTCLA